VQVISKHQHKANNIASYIPLLEQGFGIGLLAEVSAREFVKKKQLIPVLPDWYAQKLQLSLIYPARLHMAKRTRLLLDFIRNKLGD
ncbi:LysR substrate-binding domain-containing protein, partial [Vibrio makurazakiensis]|uniref:LysR substrate-binding domain-containing protein n=1 Tax=Vibrio makurazakiensis TaxID=2910250 RepID=UPI003D107C57